MKATLRLAGSGCLSDSGTADERSRIQSGERAKLILIMRFVHEMTLDQVGQALGITRERVRQIEAKAMRSIRSNNPLRERALSYLAD